MTGGSVVRAAGRRPDGAAPRPRAGSRPSAASLQWALAVVLVLSAAGTAAGALAAPANAAVAPAAAGPSHPSHPAVGVHRLVRPKAPHAGATVGVVPAGLGAGFRSAEPPAARGADVVPDPRPTATAARGPPAPDGT